MHRTALTAVSLSALVLALPAWAIAQTGPGGTTSSAATVATTTVAPAATTTTTGATTAATTTAPGPTGPPGLSTLRLAKAISSEQGHARFLVGIRSRTPATVAMQIFTAKDKRLVRTLTSAQGHPRGAVWFLVQAVDEQGYQLASGPYRVELLATDSRGRKSRMVKGAFRLNLTPPRARLDGYTIPNLPAIARQLKIAPGGQLVTALRPKGALVNAGLRRGDVITMINNRDVTTPGQWQAAQKALPADVPFPVAYRRGAEARSGMLQVPADWTPAPDYTKTFRVLIRRDPKLGYLLASARSRVDAGKPNQAQTQFGTWPAALQKTAIGQMLAGDILLAKNDLKGSLAAYNRAVARGPALGPALLGKGLVLSRLDRTAEAVPVFQAAVAQDPGNAVAQAFLAYALVATQQNDLAIAAASQAVTLDPKYEDGPIAKGLALIAAGRKAEGIAVLKKGLLLLSDQKRADQLIVENLEPNS